MVLEEKVLLIRSRPSAPAPYGKNAEILAKHPLGKVPWIEDGELVIYDSTVINEYLNEKSERNPLLAREPAKRALARALENYADEGVLSKFLPLIWMPWWSAEEQRDTDSMEKGRQRLRNQVFPFLEQTLAGNDYLCGEFSLADVPMMAVAMVLEVDGMAVGDFAQTDEYFQRLRERASYRGHFPQTLGG